MTLKLYPTQIYLTYYLHVETLIALLVLSLITLLLVELVVHCQPSLPHDHVYGLDGVNDEHHDVEAEEDEGCVTETDEVDCETGNGWSDKVAQGKGREPNSLKR